MLYMLPQNNNEEPSLTITQYFHGRKDVCITPKLLAIYERKARTLWYRLYNEHAAGKGKARFSLMFLEEYEASIVGKDTSEESLKRYDLRKAVLRLMELGKLLENTEVEEWYGLAQEFQKVFRKVSVEDIMELMESARPSLRVTVAAHIVLAQKLIEGDYTGVALRLESCRNK